MSFPWFPTPCLTQLAGRREADAQRGPEGVAWALLSQRNLCWFKRQIRIEAPEKQPFPEAWAFLGGQPGSLLRSFLGVVGNLLQEPVSGSKASPGGERILHALTLFPSPDGQIGLTGIAFTSSL